MIFQQHIISHHGLAVIVGLTGLSQMHLTFEQIPFQKITIDFQSKVHREILFRKYTQTKDKQKFPANPRDNKHK